MRALRLDQMLRYNSCVAVIWITATKLQCGFTDAIVSPADSMVGAGRSLIVGRNGPSS